MKPKIYIETSVISYYTSRPSRDIVTAGRQQITREWWDENRKQIVKKLKDGPVIVG